MVFLAIPVAHAAGGWIAYAGTGYVAGTLSATWAGCFVAANATAIGTITAATAGAAAWIGLG